jgi:hypothetical protein
MAAINYLTLRSTLYYTAPGTLAAPSTVFTVNSGGQAQYTSNIAVSGLKMASTSISLGASTNQSYPGATSGSYASSLWGSTLTGQSGIQKVAMSQSGQYQFVGSAASTIQTTSNTGISWSTLAGAGLPTGSQVSYPAVSASATGQYVMAAMKGGQVYTSSDFGATFSTIGAPAVYLPFNGSTADVSGNVSTIVVGSPTYVNNAAVGTQSIFFNNTLGSAPTQMVYVPWTGVGTTNFTISFWMNPQTLNGPYQIVFANSTTATCYVNINTSNQLYYVVPNGGATSGLVVATTTYGLTVNTWYQVVCTFITNGTCSLYVNNQLIGSAVQSGGIGSSFSNFQIGGYINGTGGAASFNGYIDDFKIYTNAILPPAPAPTVYFPFDGSTTDMMGGVVTQTGTPTYVTGYSSATKQAVYLNNTAGGTMSQYVRVPLSMGTGPCFTVQFAFQAVSFPSSGQSIIFTAGSASYDTFYITISNTGALSFLYQTSVNGYVVVSMGTVTTGTWYTVKAVYTYGAASGYLYLNGTQVATFVPVVVYAATTTLCIGGNAASATANAFNGYIDDFRFTVLPNIYLPMDGSFADVVNTTSTAITAPGSAPTYVTGAVGAQAVNLANTAGGSATYYLRGPWGSQTSFTVSFWFNAQSYQTSPYASNGQIIFSAYTSNFVLYIPPSKVIQLYNASNSTTISTTFTISLSTWYNVVLTYTQGGLVNLYVNGTFIGNAAAGASLPGTNSNYFGLGSYDTSNAQCFNGYLDDVKIYNYVMVPGGTQPNIYLSFENNSAPYQDAMGNSTITATGTPGLVAGQVGTKALYLPNADNGNATKYLRGTWAGSTNFTVSFWFNMTAWNSTNSQEALFCAYSNSVIIMIYGSSLSVYSPGATINSSSRPSLNTWYHVAYMHQNGGTCSLYLNGSLVGTATITAGTSSGNFGLGTYDTTTTTGFNGYIDDFRIYNSVVPLSTVFNPVTAGVYVPTSTNLYLPFDGSVVDMFGGAVTTYGPSQALYLNNTSPGGTAATKYVTIPFSSSATANFSFSGWFNIQVMPTVSHSTIISFGQNVNNSIAGTCVNIYCSTAGVIMFQWCNSSGSFTAITGPTISLNTWYYFVCVIQPAGTCTLYMNGTSYSAAGAQLNFAITTANIGVFCYTSYASGSLNAYIDDFRIYNSAITYSNINTAPYIYLPFDNGFTDIIGNSSVTTTGSPTQVAGVTYVTGVNGQAINLMNIAGGTAAQFVRVPVTLSNTPSFTVSFWFNAQTLAGGQLIMFSVTSPTPLQEVSVIALTSAGVLNTQWYNAAGVWTTVSSSTITTNTWNYVVLNFNAGATSYLYLNNVLTNTFTPSATLNAGSPMLSIGANNAFALAFNGYIDDFRFTTNPLTQNPTIPFACTQSAISGTGQYMLAAAMGGGLFQSSNYGQSWSQVLTTLLTNPWNSLSMSASGQYMLTMGGGMTTPNQSGLAAATWVQNGVQWTASASSINGAGWSAFYAFNNGYANSAQGSWASAHTYTDSTGLYPGTVTTTILGGVGTVSGEWLQLQSSVPLVMQSYSYACGGAVGDMPKTYYIVGSTDGTNWYPIQYASMATNPITAIWTTCNTYITVNQSGTQTIQGGQLGSGSFITYSTTTNAYTYFRIIATTLFPSSGYFELAEWTPVFLAGESYSSNYGGTWSPVSTYSSDAFNIVKSAQLTSSLSSYITMPSFTPSSAGISFCAWFSLASITNWMRIFDFGVTTNKGNGPYDWGDYFMGIVNNALVISMQMNVAITGTAYSIYSSTTLSTNTLYHAVWTIAPNGILTLYLNGTQNGTTQGVLNIQTFPYCYLGKSNWAADPYFNGTIADFRMYNRAISATEVAALYAQTPLVNNPTPNLAGITSTTWGQNGLTWTSSASSNSSGSLYLFNNVANPGFNTGNYYNGNTGAYTSLTPTTTTVLGGVGSISGEWMQIQSSTPLIMNSFSLASGGWWQFPKTYYLVGSTDNTTWYPIQSGTFAANPYTSPTNYTISASYIIVNSASSQSYVGNTSTTVTTVTYSSNTTSAYSYFRIIVPSMWGNSGGTNAPNNDSVAIGEWFINFSNPAPITSSLTNSIQPQQSGLVASTWTQAGVNWTADKSSQYSTFAPYQAFNNINNSTWASAANTYNASTGAYSANTTSTTVLGGVGAVAGDYLQIQSNIPLTMVSYTFTCGGPVTQTPKTYYIVGSTDGTNWYPIQYVTMGSNPFTSNYSTASTYITVNQAGTQSLVAGASATLTCTTYSTTANAYTYFRLITTFTWLGVLVEIGEWYINFANPAPLSINTNPYSFSNTSENGQYTLMGYGQQAWLNSATPTGLASNSATVLTLPGINANINCASLSSTGQYMTIMTQGTTNNVFYSTNYGASWTALTIGSSPMTGCAISYDGSYITVSNATTVYTLNLNGQGYTVALGNQAGLTNQGLNSIAIGNQAGQTNQSANSIVLNATGAVMNAYTPGFYVGPIASTASSNVSSVSILGYGADSQVTQTAVTTLSMPANPYATMHLDVGTALSNPFIGRAINYGSQHSPDKRDAVSFGRLDGAGTYGNIGGLEFLGMKCIVDTNINIGYGSYVNQAAITFHTWGNSVAASREVVRINPAGFVGIGTTTPSYYLDVWGNGTASISTSSLNPYLRMQNTYGAAYLSVGSALGFNTYIGLQCGSTTTAGLATPTLIVSNNNCVGIGTIIPGISLDVYGADNTSLFRVRGPTTGIGYDQALTILTKNSGSTYTSYSVIQASYEGSAYNNLSLNPNGGSVGIGTNLPTATLQVVGSLAKSSGTFDIPHPLYPDTDKRLVHSFIEGPRCDLIYRGKITLVAGYAALNIDQACTHSPEGAMDNGTFDALCTNAECFLQNKTGFDRVIGSVTGSTLTIRCENAQSTDTIVWMVVAERKDPFIKKWDRTDANGFLVTQYTQPQVTPAVEPAVEPVPTADPTQ